MNNDNQPMYIKITNRSNNTDRAFTTTHKKIVNMLLAIDQDAEQVFHLNHIVRNGGKYTREFDSGIYKNTIIEINAEPVWVAGVDFTGLSFNQINHTIRRGVFTENEIKYLARQFGAETKTITDQYDGLFKLQLVA